LVVGSGATGSGKCRQAAGGSSSSSRWTQMDADGRRRPQIACHFSSTELIELTALHALVKRSCAVLRTGGSAFFGGGGRGAR